MARSGVEGMLASLVAAFASGETAHAMKRVRSAAIAYVAAGVAAVCGAGFLVGAGYIWVEYRYGGLKAALFFGAGFLVLAVVILVVHRLVAGARARRIARRRSTDLATLGIAAALTTVPVLLRSKGVIIAPLAALAAYAIYRENRRPDPGDRDSAAD